jgi:hypothetical protein
MAKGDRFWRKAAQHDAMNKAETEGRVADSMEVRTALVEKMNSGELTLQEVQAELKRIKRDAKKNGLVTRNQAYRGY